MKTGTSSTLKSIPARLLAVLATAALALAMIPAMAFGADVQETTPSGTGVTPGTTGVLTLANLESGDTVNLYQIVSSKYDDKTNNLTNSIPKPFKDFKYGSDENTKNVIEALNGLGDDSASAKAVADSLAQYVYTESVTATKTYELSSAETSCTFGDLFMGEYLVLVSPGEDNADTVYQSMLVSFVPTPNTDKKGYVLATPLSRNVKCVKIKPEKTVKKSADSETYAKYTDNYMAGTAVPFKVTANVPDFSAVKGITHSFSFVDILSSGLNFDPTTLALDITVGTSPATTLTEGSEGDYAVAFDGVANKMTVTFDYNKLAIRGLQGKSMTITYNAMLTKNASTHENNDSYISFDKKNSSHSSADVYTYQASFKKMAGDTGRPLGGAGFNLYRVGASESDSKVNDVLITSEEDGIVKFGGLAEGTYYFKEMNVPSGFQTVPDIYFTIGEIQEPSGGAVEALYDFSTDGNPASIPSLLAMTTQGRVATLGHDGEVVDPAVAALPMTGGAGTIAFTAIGLILMAGAIVLVVRYRRKAGN